MLRNHLKDWEDGEVGDNHHKSLTQNTSYRTSHSQTFQQTHEPQI